MRKRRAPGSRGGAVVHALAILFLLVGVISPLASAEAASPATPGNLTATQPQAQTNQPSQVSIVGDFQQALGCPANWDQTCATTALTDNGDGTWSGAFPIPAGTYHYRAYVITPSGQASLGTSANPANSNDDYRIRVPARATSVYFNYDGNTASGYGTVTATASQHHATLTTDFGAFAMAPLNNGDFELYFESPAGQHPYQVSIDDQPVGSDTINLDEQSRVHIVVDARGNTVTKETVPPATPQGQPQAPPVPQVQPTAPPVATAAPQQPTAGPVNPNANAAGASVTIASFDENGQPLPGACFSLDGGQPVCDAADGSDDGTTTIPSVQPGAYTLSEPTPPAGYQAIAPEQITVTAGNNEFQVHHLPAANRAVATAPAAATAPAGAATTGILEITTVDAATGRPIPGACYQLSNNPDRFCDGGNLDADGAANGVVVITQVRPIPRVITQVSAPAGYEVAAPQQVTVAASTTPTALTFRDQPSGRPATAPAQATAPAAASPQGTAGSQQIQPLGPNGIKPAGTVAAAATGTLQITTVNSSTGDPLPGACYQLRSGGDEYCDGGNGDSDGAANGVLVITDVSPGARVATQTTPPDGYSLASAAAVAVKAGATAKLTVRNTALGTVRITTVDQNGNPLSGACFTLDGGNTQVCDDQQGDADTTDKGVVVIEGVKPGARTVTETQAPDGYQAGRAQTVAVGSGQTANVKFTNQQVLGVLEVTTVDSQSGQPIPKACYQLNGDSTTFCDGGAGDADRTANGVLRLTGVLPGDRTLTETKAPDGYLAAAPAAVTVVAGNDPSTITIKNDRATGSIRVTKLDSGTGKPVAGACFSIGGPDQQICDGQPGDGAPDDQGVVVLQNVPSGGQTVTETQAPPGYTVDQPSAKQVTVAADQQATVQFSDTKSTATLTIRTQDAQGNPLGKACYAVTNDGGSSTVCDDAGTGTITADNLTPGQQTIHEQTPPAGYQAAPDQTVTVSGGQSKTVTFTNSQATGDLQITKVDASNPSTLLAGACFSLTGASTVGKVCDNQPGKDADPTDGIILLQNLPPGNYTIHEETAPADYTAGPDTPVTITAGGTAKVTIQNTAKPATGSLQITTADATTGKQLGNACYALIASDGTAVPPVCDNEANDHDPTVGVILIQGLATGRYTVTQTRTPDGYTTATDQTAQIAKNQTANLTVKLQPVPPATGNIVVVKRGPDQQLLGGACFALDNGHPLCDNDPNDGDPTAGRIEFRGVTVGKHTLTETTPPQGYVVSQPSQDTTVVADKTVEVTFTDQPAPPQTGSVEFKPQDEQGNPVTGACLLLTDSTGKEFGPYCDNGAGDTNPAEGVITVKNLPTGVYSVTQSGGTGAAAAAAAAAPVHKTITIVANQTIIVIIIIIIQPPTTGDVVVIKRDAANQALLGGSCFKLSNSGYSAELCDNDGNDKDGTPGRIRFNGVPLGAYTLTETQAPAGYDKGPNQTVVVKPGITQAIVNDKKVVTTGELVVKKVKAGNAPLPGACFELLDGNILVAGPRCDQDDGANDGTITFNDVTQGTYTLRETRVPSSDYLPVGDQMVTINAGKTTTLTIQDALKPGVVVIRKVDSQTGAPLSGSCFELTGAIKYLVCDNDQNDGNSAAGTIEFDGVAPGTYVATETQPPVGYNPGADQAVNVAPGKTSNLTFKNTKLPTPPQTGSLAVKKVDEAGKTLVGACFSLLQNGVTRYGPRCDTDDGTADGTTTFNGVGIGSYALHETKTPSDNYLVPDDRTVTILPDKTVTVTVTNKLKPGRIAITKQDIYGNPIQGACFNLVNAGTQAQCTDATGSAMFSNLKPGTYTLTETKAPLGFLKVSDVSGIVVNPGLTTPLTLVDKLAPPPQNTGSVRVIKFYCPAGKSQPRTDMLVSTTPQNSLSQTANCNLGDAKFTLLSTSGEGGPGTFNTGPDGTYQVVLSVGSYKLTEIAPQLGGTMSKVINVAVGQQTTVVVLNYLPPPPPKPATINIAKYTCAPGFGGTHFADFVANCGGTGALTNNVTFRISGQAVAKHLTGDTGQQGKTAFANLTPGSYTLSEEAPVGTATVFGFCGTDPNAPTVKTVNGSIGLDLNAGDIVTCTWFNVPQEVTPTAGAILVHKYACNIQTPPANYAWYDECNPLATGQQFSLSVQSGTTFVPKMTGTTDDAGLLRFSLLAPGTYQLKEIGATWCHAESNSVDAKGNVIVKANQRSDVWIFNCVPTKAPPNTGAGPLAGGWHAPSSGFNLALGLAWPLAMLGGFEALRRKRRAA